MYPFCLNQDLQNFRIDRIKPKGPSWLSFNPLNLVQKLSESELTKSNQRAHPENPLRLSESGFTGFTGFSGLKPNSPK
jgi:hypothetical protein